MDEQTFKQIIQYIVSRGVEAIKENTDEFPCPINYLAIFTKDEVEYEDLLKYVKTLGEEADFAMAKTGSTFILKEAIDTEAGPLKYVKIRKPDPTRPQGGAPDFKVKNYDVFKEKYLKKSGNFTLMLRDDFEMVELKGVDVLVYFPNKVFQERI